jgi:opacity protein-like surface antigen
VPAGRDLQTDMISPCRIHRARNRVDPLPLALLFAASLLALVVEAMGQETAGSTSEEAGVSWLSTIPFHLTVGVDAGYDDHVIGRNAATGSSGQTSFFARENVVLSYDRPRERSELRLVAVGRFSQFFDLGTDDKDVNITLSLTHNFSTRLSFRADVYAAYQTEPNFQSNVGPENVRAPHFDTRDIFSLTYHWLPRFNTVTSYTFDRTLYAQSSSVGTSSNRAEQTLGEQFRFSLTSRTNLIGEYRFETINYDSVTNNNSIIHFALAGVDHRLTEHLSFHVLGGESFRSVENDGNSVSPSFEGGVNYTRSNHSLTWTTSYGFEAPTTANVSTRTTWRTGLNLTYHLTSRVHSTAAVYYNHNENEGSTSSGTGAQDSLQLILGLGYTINKRLTLHADYEHTMQSSQGSTSGYSRNRYSAGLSYTY